MSDEQIKLYYQLTPLYLWPVQWVSILRTRAWIELESLRVGGRIEVVLGLTWWGTLHVVAICDKISGYQDPKAHRYEGKITFASLCEGFTNTSQEFRAPHEGRGSLHTLALCASAYAGDTEPTAHAPEHADALIPIP